VSQTKQKKEDVPRHIELTAVLRDLKTKNKVNRIEDLKNQTFSQNK
jgi:hypothetical protein